MPTKHIRNSGFKCKCGSNRKPRKCDYCGIRKCYKCCNNSNMIIATCFVCESHFCYSDVGKYNVSRYCFNSSRVGIVNI